MIYSPPDPDDAGWAKVLPAAANPLSHRAGWLKILAAPGERVNIAGQEFRSAAVLSSGAAPIDFETALDMFTMKFA